jgi:UDP-3-O-[3-hydroxymyristoyl] glucosamine N-acyltransferase
MNIGEIATLLSGELQGDASRDISGIAGLETAGPADLTYAEDGRALEQAKRSGAGCILVSSQSALEGKAIIRVANPKLALIKAAAMVLPIRRAEPGTHVTAVVGAGVSLAPGVSVGAQTVIGEGATVGERTCIASGVFIGRGVEIGADSVIHPRVTIYSDARIGNRVVIHAGTVIGADGFGYVFAEGRHQKFPQLGKVIIEDDIEIGSNVSIDRGSLGDTMIGQGTKIDNLVQIAHNVRIGHHCVIAAQTGISGSVEIGNFVVIGGQVGIGDKVRIEDQVVIGAQAGIPTGKVVRRGSVMWGTPARPMSEFKKIYAQIANLPNLAKKVKQLAESLAAKSNTTDTKG